MATPLAQDSILALHPRGPRPRLLPLSPPTPIWRRTGQPDLVVVACVASDGKAETGPLAALWRSSTFLDPLGDSAVLPILHLNGWKIANRKGAGPHRDHETLALVERLRLPALPGAPNTAPASTPSATTSPKFATGTGPAAERSTPTTDIAPEMADGKRSKARAPVAVHHLVQRRTATGACLSGSARGLAFSIRARCQFRVSQAGVDLDALPGPAGIG